MSALPSNIDAMLDLRQQMCHKQMVSMKTEVYTVEALQFSILSSEDILKLSELKISNKELYSPMTQNPMPFGVLDDHLGATKDKGQCKTCGRTFQDCSGHWGHITLHQPVLHIGYFKHLLNLLYCICKTCSRLLLSDEDKKIFLAKGRRCHDAIQRRALLKTLVNKCKREAYCLNPQCRSPQGILRRVMKPSLDQFMKIVLQKKVRKDGLGTAASRTTIVNEDLDPNYIRQLLKRISAVDCAILDVHLPEKLIISTVLVPPKCIRPSVSLGDAGTNEDDLTIVFSEIVDTNNILKAQSEAGMNSPSILGNWELLQLQCTRFINSEALAVQPLLASKNISFGGRGICQRLKGKDGRFRGNLSGKRVDFSGRTVISPDANCPISDVVVPMWSAKRLTFPEHVCKATITKLRKAVLNGADEWPGALFVIKKEGGKTSLRFANRRQVAENLQYGDIVERHLWDGDVVLFNRQPSLHRVSIMAHRARVMPWKTFRFNECVCTPYNADFDGDEMNCHLPQTQEARAEALYLMGVVNNLMTPKNGEPLIAATQDFLLGAYLLTNKDTFITRENFCQYCCYFTDGLLRVDLPPPTILKPVELWTGKQVINVLLRPNRDSVNILVNLELREREFSQPSDGLPDFMCPRDGYVIFDHSELLCGAVAKMTLGNGSKKGMIYHLIRDNTPQVATSCLGRLAKLIGRWLSNRGMTIGIDDVTPTAKVSRQKGILLAKGYQDIDREIEMYKKKQLQPNPGCTLEETLEIRVKCILDELRSLAGKMANEQLPFTNKPLIMFLSGAKGALINVAQMIALVGQQNVSGQRIQNGFVERTLPHFDSKCQTAKSRGFVAHSFFDGLDPDEFFFHTMSGREGLVDTAVKTAETGYMQRRLVKALEDLSVCYDRTVRTSEGQIVQFIYGDDGLNPIAMESKKTFLSLDRLYKNVCSMIRIKNCDAWITNSTPHKSLSQPKQTELNLSTTPTHQHDTPSTCPHHGPGKCNNDTLYCRLTPRLFPLTVLPPDHLDHDAMHTIQTLVQLHLNEVRSYLAQRCAARKQHDSEALGSTYPDNDTSSWSKEKKRPRDGEPQLQERTTTDSIPSQPALTLRALEKKKRVATGHSRGSLRHQLFHTVPRFLREKLIAMESWRVSPCFQPKDPHVSFSLNHDPCYVQAQNNLVAHVTVHEWLPPEMLHIPLFPFEIEQWGQYLVQRTAESLPSPLCEHQKVCLDEPSTHQALTKTVRSFQQELSQWIQSKVRDVADYRQQNNIEPADTFDSYCRALEALTSITPEKDASGNNGVALHSYTSSLDDEEDQKTCSRFALSPYPNHPLLRRLWIVSEQHGQNDATQLTIPNDTLHDAAHHVADENTHDIAEKSDTRKTFTSLGLRRWKYNKTYWVTPQHLLEFFRLAWRKYNQALTEPGEAVGAIGAQSIGEPGTQMTLKTFHFAGVASMNVTLGVPRIKEILNASTKITTPIIQVTLENQTSFDYALMVKSRMEKTLLGSVCLSLKQVFSPEGAYLSIKLDMETISKNFLPITAESVQKSLLATPGLFGLRVSLKPESVVIVSPSKLRVHPPVTQNIFFNLQLIKQKIQAVRLSGLENIKRGVIKQEPIKGDPGSSPRYMYSLAVEGYGLREVMGTEGVLGTQCTSNHVMEVKQILGIEAARHVIIDEIRNCMEAYSMDIDSRHMQLLGDVMTFRGDVLGVSRFGIQKTRASTLMLASFEETNEHLFEAAAHNREDKIRGVSECIIMGKPISLGTGAFDLLYNYKQQTAADHHLASWHHASTHLPLAQPFHVSKRSSLLLSKYIPANRPQTVVAH